MQIGYQWGAVFVSTRLCPRAVGRNGVDFAIVRQVTERLSQFPFGQGIGREALVEQADRRLHAQVTQVLVKLRQVFGHAQAFVYHHLVGQAAHIKIVMVYALFNAAAGDEHAAFHVFFTPA